jgi:hypothetical protein
VGLSSHTATAVNGDTVVVIGREGGVREQRRFGDVFLLRLDFERRTYYWEEAPFKINSRSGHTAAVMRASSSAGPVSLVVFGGRQDDPHQTVQFPASEGIEMRMSQDFSRYSSVLATLERTARPISEERRGLRHHAMLHLAPNYFVVHGGEHFQARDNVSGRGNNFWLISTKLCILNFSMCLSLYMRYINVYIFLYWLWSQGMLY